GGAARRDRHGDRPARDDPGGQGGHPRCDRVPQGAVGCRPAHGGAGPRLRGAAARAGYPRRGVPDNGAAYANEGATMTEALSDFDYELLQGKNFAHVSVNRPDGAPHVTVVWIDAQE